MKDTGAPVKAALAIALVHSPDGTPLGAVMHRALPIMGASYHTR